MKAKCIPVKILAVFLVAATAVVSVVYYFTFVPHTSVPYGKYPFRYETGMICTVDGKYIFDSGAQLTYVADSVHGKTVMGAAISVDGNKKRRFVPLCYMSKLDLFPGFGVGKLVFVNKAPLLSYSDKNDGTNGIIGMNILCRANWHFSFRDSFFESMPLDREMQIPSHAIALSYDRNLRPKITVTIANQRYDNILIDMGCNSDFCFEAPVLKNIMTKTHPQKIAEDTSFCMYSFCESMSYAFERLDIFGKAYQNIDMHESKINHVGMKFLSRFDHLFWDSRHRKVYLWNEEEKNDSNR